ncbi:MAG: DUF5107 domain-containing protein [Flavobacteriaceae bacterium]
MNVKVWKEIVTIPTYEIGKPEKNPIFIENRVYQGSSGKVYPLPIIEKINDEKVDKPWQAVFLENDFIKIMILPELGGRIQMAYDKTKQRHFVYYNQVIKPALVGLTGPWISGGIEFNWPQHHRPSTYSPTDFDIEENQDGSKTVWCSEVEQMFRTKGMAGFTLYPDKAYLEIKVKLYNRTPQPQTFLWWANPAVKVNDHYQSVFPPDVHAVFDHGKRDVSSFPVATGTYYKVDYAPGTDISMYKNIPVPTSYMAVNSDYNFVGGYENDSNGGLLHVADHHVSPGKKQWTWGNGDFGVSWDRNLTDEDGPYIELMCGVYTDNQPDFSWMHPFEEKTFSQYFMPYRDLGVVKNATKEALLNLEIENNLAIIKSYTLGVYPNVRIELKSNEKIIFEEIYNASPEMAFETQVPLGNNISSDSLCLTLYSQSGAVLVQYNAKPQENKLLPESAKPAKLPKDIEHIEQLYLTGLHLEQYRHATYRAKDYYLEALSRDPKDVRCNNALGLLLLRNGRFKKAEAYFKTAIETLTQRNPNPYDGEPYYNLGQSLKYQGRYNEAYAAFYKSAWNAHWQDAAYFHLAQIATLKQDYALALELVEKALIRNWHNHRARTLKTALLRKTNQTKQALQLVENSLAIDKFNFGIWFEKYLLTTDKATLSQLTTLLRNNMHSYIEYALDYADAGLFNEAIRFITEGIKNCASNPMAYYFCGWFEMQNGNKTNAKAMFEQAKSTNVEGCFAYRLEAVNALQCAIKNSPDPKAYYHLGNLWYDKKQYTEAVSCWEQSKALDNQFPTVHRNLSLAYFNKKANPENALNALETAFNLDPTDARLLFELDCLYKRLNHSPEKRLVFLNQYPDLVNFRDDLYLERCTLLNQLGRYNEALALLETRKFHPWEGGEGKVTGQYLFALIALAKEALLQQNYQTAIEVLKKTEHYPHNLSEGKLHGTQENDIHYWLGCAYFGLNKESEAKAYWEQAAVGLSEPSAAIFYNDQQPDKIFYQGLACLKLGKTHDAEQRFQNLITYGEKHINDAVKIDYFAVSLPDLLIWDDDLNKRNTIHCHYLMGLGQLGLNHFNEAEKEFKTLLQNDVNHLGGVVHLQLLKHKKNGRFL